MSRIGGFGDLREDSGERGIQSGRINDVRSKSLKSISKKAQAHARWETASMREDVRRQQQVVVDAARRIFQNCDRESAATRKENRKASRAFDRDALLEITRPTGDYEIIRESKQRLILGSGTSVASIEQQS